MTSFVSQFSTRIAYGAFPSFSLDDLLSAFLEGLSCIWIELTISVFVTLGYAVFTGSFAGLSRPKAAKHVPESDPPDSDESQDLTVSTQTSDKCNEMASKGAVSSPSKRARGGQCDYVKVACWIALVFGLIAIFVGLHLAPDAGRPRAQLPETEKTEGAIEILQRQLKQANTSVERRQILMALMAAFRARGDLQGALAHGTLALELMPDDFSRHEVLLAIATMRRRLGDFDAASEVADKAEQAAMAASPSVVEPGCSAEADVDALGARISARKSQALARAERATILMEKGKLVESDGVFRLARSSGADVAVKWAAVDILRGDAEGALPALRAALERLVPSMERAEAFLWLGRALRDTGDMVGALKAAQESENLSAGAIPAPDLRIAALLDEAELYMEDSRFTEAGAAINTVNALLPPSMMPHLHADAVTVQAALALRRGYSEEAEQLALRALNLQREARGVDSPGKAKAMVLSGRIFLALGKPQEAFDILEEARKTPSWTSGFFQGEVVRAEWYLADAYAALGKSIRADILRRKAVDEALRPGRGKDDLPGAEAVRRAATALLGSASLLNGEARARLCPILQDTSSPVPPADSVASRRKASVIALDCPPAQPVKTVPKRKRHY